MTPRREVSGHARPRRPRLGGSPDQQQKSTEAKERDMQSSERNNIGQRFGHALDALRTILAEHEKTCAERVQAAEAKAQDDRARFAEASEELAQARRELSALSAERDRLPFEAYAANLDGDAEREATLKARYASIAPADLEALRGRCEALAGEVASLGGTASDAEKRALKNVRGVYASVLQSMGEFEGRIDLLKSAVAESRSKYWSGQRDVAEQLNSLRGIEQAQRREERAEAARRSEGARRGAGRGPVL